MTGPSSRCSFTAHEWGRGQVALRHLPGRREILVRRDSGGMEKRGHMAGARAVVGSHRTYSTLKSGSVLPVSRPRRAPFQSYHHVHAEPTSPCFPPPPPPHREPRPGLCLVQQALGPRPGSYSTTHTVPRALPWPVAHAPESTGCLRAGRTRSWWGSTTTSQWQRGASCPPLARRRQPSSGSCAGYTPPVTV